MRSVMARWIVTSERAGRVSESGQAAVEHEPAVRLLYRPSTLHIWIVRR